MRQERRSAGWVSALAFAMAVLLLPAATRATGRSAAILVVTEELPPYNFTENGVITGSSTEVVRAVMREVGLEADIVSLPWARAMNKALTQPNVLIYTIATTPMRLPQFKWVGEINSSKVVRSSASDAPCRRSRAMGPTPPF